MGRPRHGVRRRVLVGDPDPGITRLLDRRLPALDFAVTSAASAEALLAALARDHADVVILDADLPGMTTADLIRTLQAALVPVLVLLARPSEPAVIAALDAGADDCMGKPFSIAELGARLRRLVRQALARIGVPPVIRAGSLVIDCIRWRVELAGQAVTLSVQEQTVLRRLVEEGEDVVSAAALCQSLWGAHALESPARLYQIVRSLQRKLGASAARPGPVRRDSSSGFRFLVMDVSG